MMEWPKIYTKRWESNGVYHFRCSDTPQDDTWDCWCNYDRNNNQIDHFYTPIYFGSLVSGKLRSISGAANSVNTTAANEITYAKANGNDWYTEVLADRLLLQDLLVMMARSTECQTAFGYKHFSDDGTIISTIDSQGRTLVKTFSNDFLTCITVLTDPDGNELGRTVRSFSDNSSTIITTDSKGQKLVKKFSNNMLNMEAVLTDAAGKELARLTKVFSADGKDITSTVVYGK